VPADDRPDRGVVGGRPLQLGELFEDVEAAGRRGDRVLGGRAVVVDHRRSAAGDLVGVPGADDLLHLVPKRHPGLPLAAVRTDRHWLGGSVPVDRPALMDAD
jgi:hypothetical protein